MRYLFVYILVIGGGWAELHAQDSYTVYSGFWQGGDLYIQNPYSDSANAFCATEVYINKRLFKPNANSSAVHVPLENKGFQKNDRISVKIRHYPDCRPRIINKYILAPEPSKKKSQDADTTQTDEPQPFLMEEY